MKIDPKNLTIDEGPFESRGFMPWKMHHQFFSLPVLVILSGVEHRRMAPFVVPQELLTVDRRSPVSPFLVTYRFSNLWGPFKVDSTFDWFHFCEDPTAQVTR